MKSLWTCWNQTYFFSTFNMSEYFFHNTNENLKKMGMNLQNYFLVQECNVSRWKLSVLQKLTSFNYIPNRFQNIYYLIFNITILWCCGNNPMKSILNLFSVLNSLEITLSLGNNDNLFIRNNSGMLRVVYENSTRSHLYCC